MELYFQCQLLSPVVLSSQAATEGFHKSLDYIPGNVFLGIMAKQHYQPSLNNASFLLDLFHNGTVRYGDAHLVIDGQYSYPTPFSWYRKKIEADTEKKVYIHHLIHDVKDQLKQQRSGYVSATGTQKRTIDQIFSIKSAYDNQKRKSLDEQMYGYHALPAGLTFLFKISVSGPDTATYQKLLLSTLEGKHHIGRSRSAEYGWVEIKEVDAFNAPNSSSTDTNPLILYAASNWCFFDIYGFPTQQLETRFFGLTKGNINWQKSQVRFRPYQSFNVHRRNLNPASIIVQKGSVLVIEQVDPLSANELYVGHWQAEGFGHCLVNPTFLGGDANGQRAVPQEEVAAPIPPQVALPLKGKEQKSSTQIRALLQYRSDKAERLSQLQEFINQQPATDYAQITNSQWGLLRGLAKVATSDDDLLELLFKKPIEGQANSGGVLRRGQSKTVWAPHIGKLRTFLEEAQQARLALDRLADKYQKTNP